MANNTAVTTLGVGTGVAAVPTLSQWALMLLSVLLAGFAAMRMRRVHMN
ncbi:IPTL-CTERM sorting domain-containing protein [Diaphorobacter aerolatus]|uniref:IPTL-CTERM sorting domain-containing protein n=1 Tax=Diaphorobacter aerolatus TaxID=1288495 RepID=A0A7H0GI06_9BURK|nr:IPTL-CTERM sorting domain-containing protein [Diaphorobacter aerolatus]